eukprot:gene640-207_t
MATMFRMTTRQMFTAAIFGLLANVHVTLELELVGQSFLHLENTKITPVDANNNITENQNSDRNFSSIASSEIQPVESENNEPTSLTDDKYRVQTLSGDFIPNVINDTTTEEQNDLNENRNARASCRRASRFINNESVNKLQEVVAQGKKLRHRMLIITIGLGGFMTLACFTIYILLNVNVLSIEAWGRPALYISQTPAWAFSMLFGVIPNDLISIRICNLFMAVLLPLAAAAILWAAIDRWSNKRFEVVENIDEVTFMQCSADLPTLSCALWVSRMEGMRVNDNAFKRNSCEAIDSTWEAGREWCLATGVKHFICSVIAHLMKDRFPTFTNTDFLDQMFYCVIHCGIYFAYTPARRYHVVAFFTSMVVKDETKKAAAVAALLGNVNAENSLKLAKEKFRTICFSELREKDFDKNNEDPSSTNRLYSRTSRTALGECDVFLSHSWHDNGKKKFAALKSWCEKFETKNGRHPRLWLDKACIDQKEIASDLLCLPLFLAGCETLLIIAGPTYTDRLWCVMEVFVFLQMGGSIHRVTVIAIDVEDEQEAMSSFEVADINKCKCYLESDRNKLLGIVQQGFGSFEKFNEVIRQVFQERMFKERISLDQKITALAKHTANQNRIINAKLDKVIQDQAEKLDNQAEQLDDQAEQLDNQARLLENQAKLIEALTKTSVQMSQDMAALKELMIKQH